MERIMRDNFITPDQVERIDLVIHLWSTRDHKLTAWEAKFIRDLESTKARYGARMFEPTRKQTRALRNIQRKMEVLIEFIVERCERCTRGKLRMDNVYDAYLQFAREAGCDYAQSRSALERALVRHGYFITKPKREKIVMGIGLRSDPYRHGTR